MTTPLTIRDASRDGLLVITDTAWDHNGTLRVTVAEMIGERLDPDSRRYRNTVKRARRLARRAIMHPEKTRSSRLLRSWYATGQTHFTFAVSRLEA